MVFDRNPIGRPSDRAPETHRDNHQPGAVDDLSHRFLGDLHSDANPAHADPALGSLAVAKTVGTRVLWDEQATGAAGTVFIGGSTFSANLLLSGYARIGASAAGLNITPGDLTVVRLSVGNVTIATNVEAQVNGDAVITGWTRVGSVTAPTNTTPGDLTVERILAGDATLATGVVAAFKGHQTTTGWLNVGAATAPSNTTAGDLTAKRAHFGTDAAFSAGKELEVVGDGLISATLQVGTDLEVLADTRMTGYLSTFGAAAANTTDGDANFKRANVGADTALPAGKDFQVAGAAIVTGEMQMNGDINHDGTKVGFFSKAPAAQQVSAANLTNNVTAGGVDDTIANFTNLVTYSTDAAAIRNDIYQLARKVKQINDALRLYGLLS